MKWYYILLIIILTLLILTFITSLICYLMAFYNKNKPVSSDEISLPNNEIYRKQKNFLHTIPSFTKLLYLNYNC